MSQRRDQSIDDDDDDDDDDDGYEGSFTDSFSSPSLIDPSFLPSFLFLLTCSLLWCRWFAVKSFYLFLNAHFFFSFFFLPLFCSLLRLGLFNLRTPVFPGHHGSGKPRTAIFCSSVPFLFSHSLRFVSCCVHFTVDLAASCLGNCYELSKGWFPVMDNVSNILELINVPGKC